MALLQAVSKRVLDAEAANPGTVLDHAVPRGALRGAGGAAGAPGRAGRGSRPGRPPGLRAEEIDELADRYLAGGQGDHHLGHGHHAAEEGRGHHQGDHQPAAAARQHRQARRRRVADPRAQQRPGRPDHGHLGADAAGLPGRPGQGVQLRTAARARRGRRGNRPANARRRDQGFRRPGRQLRGRHFGHRRGRGGHGEHRAVGPDLHQAQPLAHGHRCRGADPAHAGPHRDRPAGIRAAVRLRGGHRLRRARLRTARWSRWRRACCPRWPSSAGWRADRGGGFSPGGLGRV